MNPYGLYIILAAVLPSLFYIRLLDYFDRFKREPRILIFKLFAAGLATPLLAMLLEMISIPLCELLPEGITIPAQAFLGIAVVEEAVKMTALVLIVRNRKEFDEILDGAVYAVAVAMGFALLENIMYVFGSEAPMSVALIRGLTAVPLHALAGGFMGLAYARDKIESRGGLSSAFLIAVLIHGAYDWFLMDSRLPGFLIYPLLIIGWWMLVRALRKARKDDILAGSHFTQ
jgi:RsiW-degrading membrane proteinase PrsW (M82 family)